MRPCTVWRTSSSLMDTSCPSIPPPLPPLPQPPRPHPARLPHPHRRPTANTMKSWRTGPAPGQWTAMKEGPGRPTVTVVEAGNPRRTAAAVPTTTTTNPGTGASPGGRVRAGAKLTPTPWESRWPQTAGKTQSVLYFDNSDILLSDWPFCMPYRDHSCPHPLLLNDTIIHCCGASMEQINEMK